MNKKYIIDKNEFKIDSDGTILYRIKAIRDVKNVYRKVKKGEWGGYVQKESNLNQYCESWLFDDSIARDDSQIRGQSAVLHSSIITENSLISNSAILDNVFTCGKSTICGRPYILNSIIGDNSVVGGVSFLKNSKTWEYSRVFDKDKIKNVTITNCIGRLNTDINYSRKQKYLMIPVDDGLYRIKANRDIINRNGLVKEGELGGLISGEHNLSQYGECWIYDNSVVSQNATVQDNASVAGNSDIRGNVVICEHASAIDCRVAQNAIIGGGGIIFNYEIMGDTRIFGSLRLINSQNRKHTIESKTNKMINLFNENDIMNFIEREQELTQ